MTAPIYPTELAATIALEQRIAQARVACEAWRRTGLIEKYLESYDLVEALQIDLQRRTRR